ncbi:hypothetical protein ACFY41_30865 [Streptomyces syringium]|uniref:hypothetical protein n=1 Tax=Streptomyces syringium TaxID=76729 RepID=UPI003673ED99
MSTPAPNQSFRIAKPADVTYAVWDTTRFETGSDSWVAVPGAEIDLKLGQGRPSLGAVFVATFSAEALCSDPSYNQVLKATVFFGDQQAEPVSDNHRFATARGHVEWSSHTLIRTARFEPELALRDVTARVKLKIGTGTEGNGGVQNWVLKIERFNL